MQLYFIGDVDSVIQMGIMKSRSDDGETKTWTILFMHAIDRPIKAIANNHNCSNSFGITSARLSANTMASTILHAARVCQTFTHVERQRKLSPVFGFGGQTWFSDKCQSGDSGKFMLTSVFRSDALNSTHCGFCIHFHRSIIPEWHWFLPRVSVREQVFGISEKSVRVWVRCVICKDVGSMPHAASHLINWTDNPSTSDMSPWAGR